MDNMEFLKAMLAEMNAKMDTNQVKGDAKQEKMLAEMSARMDANNNEMNAKSKCWPECEKILNLAKQK
jgi:hypothetical protein